MQSSIRVQPPLSEDDVRRGIEKLSPWFYSLDLGRGLTTKSAVPASVSGIFLTRLEMVERVVRAHFGQRIGMIDCLDIGCHEGYYALAVARLGARRVVGLEPREENLRRAQFVAAATCSSSNSPTASSVSAWPSSLRYSTVRPREPHHEHPDPRLLQQSLAPLLAGRSGALERFSTLHFGPRTLGPSNVRTCEPVNAS